MNKEEILKARKALSMSQQDFAEAIGTTQLSVSRWENGKCLPNQVYLRQIKKLLEQKADKNLDLLNKIIEESNANKAS